MKRTALLHKGEGADAVRAALKEKALELHDKDIEVCRKIGEYGARLLENCDSVLTHCNAGRPATVKYGTRSGTRICSGGKTGIKYVCSLMRQDLFCRARALRVLSLQTQV